MSNLIIGTLLENGRSRVYKVQLNQAVLLYESRLLILKKQHIPNQKLKFGVFREGAGGIRE